MDVAIGANGDCDCHWRHSQNRHWRQWSIHWRHSLSPMAPNAPLTKLNDTFTDFSAIFSQIAPSKPLNQGRHWGQLFAAEGRHFDEASNVTPLSVYHTLFARDFAAMGSYSFNPQSRFPDHSAVSTKEDRIGKALSALH